MTFPNQTLYIIRHCKSSGQQPDARLTAEGYRQARILAERLAAVPFEQIISSPFRRAIDSIAPLATRLHLPIEIDERLAERVLSPDNLPDWLDKLRLSFEDLDFCLHGGESSRTAMQRSVAAIEDVLTSERTTAVVTHGNLMALLLMHFDARFGFAEWQALANPDVYQVMVGGGNPVLRRIDIAGYD